MVNFEVSVAVPDECTTKLSYLSDDSETCAKRSKVLRTLGHETPFETAEERGEVRLPNGKLLPDGYEDILQGYQPKDLVNPVFLAPTIGPPDKRSLWATISEDEGESLENCETPRDLCKCLLHAKPSWLGYFNIDISIGT